MMLSWDVDDLKELVVEFKKAIKRPAWC
jgi:hypothetical protein